MSDKPIFKSGDVIGPFVFDKNGNLVKVKHER